jgi:NAD(P)H-quinone oxidoreductase subunit 4L
LIRIEHVMVVAALLFSIGLYVALTRRNAVGVLMGVELMLNSVNLNLVGFARLTEAARQIDGQVFAVFVITVAAAEASVGLALAVLVYRYRHSIDVDRLDLLKW